VPFDSLDTGAVARLLALVAEQEGDIAEVFFERRETVELPPVETAPGVRRWREEGLAVRLARGATTWLASRDGISSEALGGALRQVARVVPRTGLTVPELAVTPWSEDAAEVPRLAELARRLPQLLRARHVAFPLRLTLRAHRRAVRVVGPRLVGPTEQEHFWSCTAEMPWGSHGELMAALDHEAAESLAETLLARFRARDASPPPAGERAVVLAPPAAAVLLHEVVAHALEADTLALGGRPDAALGVALGGPLLDVLDDPGAAPEGCRRTTDDEGMPAQRRWLLRGGVVEAPLADRAWSARVPALVPGAGRRASRHELPGPRSSCLELLAGEAGEGELAADGAGGAGAALHVASVRRGALDPLTGGFTLEVPAATALRRGGPGESFGPCRLRGSVSELLRRVTAVGRDVRPAGAGWCAKGGQRMPVWARTPSLRVEALRVEG
jgi:predicted Zn-dependent protease